VFGKYGSGRSKVDLSMLRHGRRFEIVYELGEKGGIVEVVGVIIEVLFVGIHCRVLSKFRR
jgi:hypothetical protein